MGKLLLGAAAVVASLSLTAGVAAAQTGGVSGHAKGPNSYVKVDSHDRSKVKVENDNKVRLNNDVYQKASSGDAKVKHNTTGGDASTGDAGNSSALSASLSLDNSGSVGDLNCGCEGQGSGDVDAFAEGPDSVVKVDSHNSSEVKVENTNKVTLNNTVVQKAKTGNATVSDNTTGGDASTGAASNTSSVSFTLDITN